MSLRNWLSPKAAPALQPVLPPGDTRRAERAAQRELLYPIVREAMVRAGILSSLYKFKVLSVDTLGQRFLVMVDLAPEIVEDFSQLSQLEALIAQQARARHDFEVTGTYWRLNRDLMAARQASLQARSPSLSETQHGELRA